LFIKSICKPKNQVFDEPVKKWFIDEARKALFPMLVKIRLFNEMPYFKNNARK
jgi:hypothetical protein